MNLGDDELEEQDFNDRKVNVSADGTSGGEETQSLRTGQQIKRRIKYADVTNSIVLIVLCAGLAILIALAAATLNKVSSQKTTIVYPYSVSVAYSSLGEVFLNMSVPISTNCHMGRFPGVRKLQLERCRILFAWVDRQYVDC